MRLGLITFIILIEAQIEILQPLNLFLAVVLGPLGADHAFDKDAAMFVELIAPVTLGAWLKVTKSWRPPWGSQFWLSAGLASVSVEDMISKYRI